MSEVTAPIMTDATGQSIDGKLNSLLGKMDNLAAAFQPNASGIVYSNTTSGLTGDDVQEAIDEMAADVSEIKQSLSQFNSKFATVTNTFGNGNLDSKTDYPTGFTSTNCVIISVMYEYQNGRWDLIPNGVLANGVLPSLRTDKITVYNTVSGLYNKNYKVTLMRTDI